MLSLHIQIHAICSILAHALALVVIISTMHNDDRDDQKTTMRSLIKMYLYTMLNDVEIWLNAYFISAPINHNEIWFTNLHTVRMAITT